MLETLKSSLKIDLCQYVAGFFDDVTKEVEISINQNKIEAELPDGEWVFSNIQPPVGSTLSSQNYNTLFTFQNKVASSDINLSNNTVPYILQNIKAHQVNIKIAFNREKAIEILTEDKKNGVIIYNQSLERLFNIEENNISPVTSREIKVKSIFGVIFHGTFFETDNNIFNMGFTELEQFFINICSYIKNKNLGTTETTFEGLENRGYVNNQYYNEYLFSYTYNLYDDKYIENRIKSIVPSSTKLDMKF